MISERKIHRFSTVTEGALDLRLTLLWLAVALVVGVAANVIAIWFEAGV